MLLSISQIIIKSFHSNRIHCHTYVCCIMRTAFMRLWKDEESSNRVRETTWPDDHLLRLIVKDSSSVNLVLIKISAPYGEMNFSRLPLVRLRTKALKPRIMRWRSKSDEELLPYYCYSRITGWKESMMIFNKTLKTRYWWWGKMY